MQGVVCFGEILLRFSPLPHGESFVGQTMPVFIGGAELNVAQALAQWHVPVSYCTAIPDNFLTEDILSFIRKKNIDTTPVYKGGQRMGVYYLAQGKDVKNDAVVFDRAGSSFSTLAPGQVKWDDVFKGKAWFHFSAIAAALSETATAVCLEALQAAKKAGLLISVDLNYRNKLWKYGKDPHEVMPALLQYCDVVMGNLWAAEILAAVPSPVSSSAGLSAEQLIAAAKTSMDLLQQKYVSVKTIAYTFRREENYFAVLRQQDQTSVSVVHGLKNVVDKVGSGDCFMAGLIYGCIKKSNPQEIINFAASAAVGKLYEKGDSTQQQIPQIKARY